MDKELFDAGLALRKKVVGAEYVERSMAAADDLTKAFQELVTEYCWGAVWTREGLSHRDRSLLNLGAVRLPVEGFPDLLLKLLNISMGEQWRRQ